MNEELSDAERLYSLGKFKEIFSSWKQLEPGLHCVCWFFLRETNLEESERGETHSNALKCLLKCYVIKCWDHACSSVFWNNCANWAFWNQQRKVTHLQGYQSLRHLPWGPNLMGEHSLTCVGLDRAWGDPRCCFSTWSLQTWRIKKLRSHMTSTVLRIGVRCWCDPERGGSRAVGAEPSTDGGYRAWEGCSAGCWMWYCCQREICYLKTGAISVSAGFLIGYQKKGTQHTG